MSREALIQALSEFKYSDINQSEWTYIYNQAARLAGQSYCPEGFELPGQPSNICSYCAGVVQVVISTIIEEVGPDELNYLTLPRIHEALRSRTHLERVAILAAEGRLMALEVPNDPFLLGSIFGIPLILPCTPRFSPVTKIGFSFFKPGMVTQTSSCQSSRLLGYSSMSTIISRPKTVIVSPATLPAPIKPAKA